MTARPSRRRPLGLEPLEDRSLLAGNVVAVLTEGTLSVLGDDAANGVQVVYDVATGKHRVLGTIQGGFPTSINGQPAETIAEFSGVKNVDVRLGAGDDKLDFGAADHFYTLVSKRLSIDAGSGNDEVVLGKAGDDSAATAEHHVYVAKGIWINLGDGDDQLEVANLKTNKSLIIEAGDGDDEIKFATEFLPEGETEADLFPVKVRGNLHVHMGQGDDELTLLHVLVGQNLLVRDPAGGGVITITDVAINEKFDVATGDGEDQVNLDMIAADELQLHTNGAPDDVNIDHTRFKRVNIKTGSGADDLTLRNSRTTYITYLDGGEGGADYSSRGNILRGLVRRRLT